MGGRASTQRRRAAPKQSEAAATDTAATVSSSHSPTTQRWKTRSFAEGRAMERYFADPAYNRGAYDRHHMQSLQKRNSKGRRRGMTSKDAHDNYYSNDQLRALRQRRAQAPLPASQPTTSAAALDTAISSTEEDGLVSSSFRGTTTTTTTTTHGSPRPHTRRLTPEVEPTLPSGEDGTVSFTTSPRTVSPTSFASRGHAALRSPTREDHTRGIVRPPQQSPPETATLPPSTTPKLSPAVHATVGGEEVSRAPPEPRTDNTNNSDNNDDNNSFRRFPAVLPTSMIVEREESDLTSVATTPQLVDPDATGDLDVPPTLPRAEDGPLSTSSPPPPPPMTFSSRRSNAGSETSSHRSIRTVAHRHALHSVRESRAATRVDVTRSSLRHYDSSPIAASATASAAVPTTTTTSGQRAARRRREPRAQTQHRTASASSHAPLRSSASVAAVERARRAARLRRRGPPNNWSGAMDSHEGRRGGVGGGMPFVVFSLYSDPSTGYNGYDGDGGGGGGAMDAGVC